MTSHLPRITPLVGIIAREKTAARPELYDDARQEGLIAAWLAEAADPTRSREYLVATARRAIAHVVGGRASFGAEGRRGWQDAHKSAGPLVVGRGDSEGFVIDPADVTAADAFAEVDELDVSGHVWRAVAELVEVHPGDPYIASCVAEGWTWDAIAEGAGRKPEACRRRFRDHIAPRLRAELAHLR